MSEKIVKITIRMQIYYSIYNSSLKEVCYNFHDKIIMIGVMRNDKGEGRTI